MKNDIIVNIIDIEALLKQLNKDVIINSESYYEYFMNNYKMHYIYYRFKENLIDNRRYVEGLITTMFMSFTNKYSNIYEKFV